MSAGISEASIIKPKLRNGWKTVWPLSVCVQFRRWSTLPIISTMIWHVRCTFLTQTSSKVTLPCGWLKTVKSLFLWKKKSMLWTASLWVFAMMRAYSVWAALWAVRPKDVAKIPKTSFWNVPCLHRNALRVPVVIFRLIPTLAIVMSAGLTLNPMF